MFVGPSSLSSDDCEDEVIEPFCLSRLLMGWKVCVVADLGNVFISFDDWKGVNDPVETEPGKPRGETPCVDRWHDPFFGDSTLVKYGCCLTPDLLTRLLLVTDVASAGFFGRLNLSLKKFIHKHKKWHPLLEIIKFYHIYHCSELMFISFCSLHNRY